MVTSQELNLMSFSRNKVEAIACVISFDRHISYPGHPPCNLDFECSILGKHRFSGVDIWECFTALRLFLERAGYLICCNGSRKDVVVSGMARNMGGGEKVYITKFGEHANRKNLVYFYKPAECKLVGTVSEQEDYKRKWWESLRRDRES